MCGRYAASEPPDLVEETYAATAVDEPPPPSWNVAPTDPVSVVVHRHDRREVRTVRWGLVPSWANDPRGAARLINARAETVATKPAFRAALLRRRCLVPADGWYEWRDRQPWFVPGPHAFAGLYEFWRDPANDTVLRTCAIVTTAAARDIAFLHDRMPVVLGTDAWEAWLDPAYDDVEGLRALLRPREGLVPYAVGRAVGDVRNNGPSLVLPV